MEECRKEVYFVSCPELNDWIGQQPLGVKSVISGKEIWPEKLTSEHFLSYYSILHWKQGVKDSEVVDNVTVNWP